MAVSGLPEPCEDHVRCIARLALDMMDLSQTVVVDGVPVVSIYDFNDFRYYSNVQLYGVARGPWQNKRVVPDFYEQPRPRKW